MRSNRIKIYLIFLFIKIFGIHFIFLSFMLTHFINGMVKVEQSFFGSSMSVINILLELHELITCFQNHFLFNGRASFTISNVSAIGMGVQCSYRRQWISFKHVILVHKKRQFFGGLHY